MSFCGWKGERYIPKRKKTLKETGADYWYVPQEGKTTTLFDGLKQPSSLKTLLLSDFMYMTSG